MNLLRLAFVSCGFLGLSPFAPGTVGTLGGVLIAWLLSRSGAFALWTVVIAVLLFLLARTQGEWAERHAGGKDPGFFVMDEVIGYLVTILWWEGPSLLALTMAFFVFRFFDVVKPWPGRRLERLGGGDGILLDDVAAGVYGLVVMVVLRVWFLEPGDWIVAP